MRTRYFIILTFSLAFAYSALAQKTNPFPKFTIEEVRRIFVGKSVRVFSKINADGKLDYWNYADKKDGKYIRKPYSIWNGSKYETTRLPSNYRWQTATIVAIELDEKSIPKTNALGEIIEEKEPLPDIAFVFVKFGDGTLASNFNSLETLSGKENSYGNKVRLDPQFGWKTFMLVSDLIQRSKIINSNINSIVGKVAFATALSNLYSINSTVTDLVDGKTRVTDFPYFEPLTIVTAKYNEEADIIILKLKDKSGKQYLTYSNFMPQKKISGFFETIITRSNLNHPVLLPEIPKYSEQQINAIKSRTIFVGMTAWNVYEALGSPEKTEYSSEPAKDIMVYFNGKLRVFISKENKVADIQDNR